MAIWHKGEEVSKWVHKGEEINTIIQHGQELHSAGNFITADGFVIETADGYIFNVQEEDGKVQI